MPKSKTDLAQQLFVAECMRRRCMFDKSCSRFFGACIKSFFDLTAFNINLDFMARNKRMFVIKCFVFCLENLSCALSYFFHFWLLFLVRICETFQKMHKANRRRNRLKVHNQNAVKVFDSNVEKTGLCFHNGITIDASFNIIIGNMSTDFNYISSKLQMETILRIVIGKRNR